METANSPLTSNDAESSSVQPSRKFAKLISEAKSLVAFAIFSVTLYLTAIAVFHRPLVSLPFSPRIIPESNHTEAGEPPDRENYIASVFSLIVMLIGSIVFGYLVDLCRLPPLLGMLIAGIVFRNAGFVDLFVVKRWGSFLRKAAFVVILLRGGLGLDANALRKLKGACVWLAVMPCTIEAIFIAISAYFLLDLPWIFGLLLGFVLAAVSPAVIVPAMLHITSKNYGVASGVPTLVIAAASVDDVYAITGFSALLSVAFSKGSVLRTIISAPIEVLAGGIFGVLIGILMWYIPDKGSKNVHFARLAVLGQLALLALFGCETLGFDSTGPIAILVGAFVAATQWKKEYSSDVEQEVTLDEEKAMALMWTFFFQPLLFTLIGFELDFGNVGLKGALLGTAVLTIGCVVRTIVAYYCTLGAGFDASERFFIALSWIPKATVQAALAPVVLDMAIHDALPESYRVAGMIILTVAVLSILLTAPIGAFAIYLTAPKLLHHDVPHQLPDKAVNNGVMSGKVLD